MITTSLVHLKVYHFIIAKNKEKYNNLTTIKQMLKYNQKTILDEKRLSSTLTKGKSLKYYKECFDRVMIFLSGVATRGATIAATTASATPFVPTTAINAPAKLSKLTSIACAYVSP